jgi:hypothetical protein
VTVGVPRVRVLSPFLTDFMAEVDYALSHISTAKVFPPNPSSPAPM